MLKRFKFLQVFFICAVVMFLNSAALSVLAETQAAEPIQDIEGFVRVQDIDPDIVVEMRYATENNFTGKKVYPVAACALRKETAGKLAAANAEFKKDGYRIKVWDAYRPPSVQKIFWEILPDDKYVANPNEGGSKHNRGGAVDITLIDKEGKELEMPTGFDDFSEKAWRNSPEMSAQAKSNVEYLTRVMENAGFIPYEHEWWHFDDSNWENFPLVDVALERFTDAPTGPSEQIVVVPPEFPEVLNTLKEHVRQAVVVEEMSPGKPQARLSAWDRDGDGNWKFTLEPVDAVLGREGLARVGMKREGDGKTPSGVFRLRTAFGYEPTIETNLEYRVVTENDFWVDDPQSPQYNQWVMGSPNAGSFERLKRDDDLYKYGVVIEYNTQPVVPGDGSAIFLHVWRGADQPTAGCVAMAESDVVALLKWLNPSKNPVIVLGTSMTP